ncbi:MAG: 6-bladed beta-propeller [Verrucomicrobiia bacterium]
MRDNIKMFPGLISLSVSFLLIHIICPLIWAAAPQSASVASYFDVLSTPTRMAIDETGNIYVTDSLRGKVAKYNGFFQLIQTKEGLEKPLGITVDIAGRIYVGEQSSGSITVFDKDFNALGKLGAGNGEFLLPNYITVARSNGNDLIFVSDSAADEIKIYSGGVLIKRFGGRGASSGQFIFPSGIAVNKDNELVVVDQGNDRIQIFDLSGNFKRLFSLAPPGVFMISGRGTGVRCDSNGRMFVSDSFACSVKVFDGQGNFISSLGNTGFGQGELYSPLDLIIDKFNRLFIASPNSSKMELFGLDCYFHFSSSLNSQIVNAGTNMILTITSSCNTNLQIQWFNGTNALSDSDTISGAKSNVLTVSLTSAKYSGDYYAIMTTDGTTVTTAVASITVLSAPVIIEQPKDQIVQKGDTATFNILVEGSQLSYQWYFNNTPILGSNSDKLIITNAQSSNEGEYYVVVTNSLGTVTSAIARLTLSEIIKLSVFKEQDGLVKLLWDGTTSILETSTNLTGVWEQITGAQSPYIISISEVRSNQNRYYRLKKN